MKILFPCFVVIFAFQGTASIATTPKNYNVDDHSTALNSDSAQSHELPVTHSINMTVSNLKKLNETVSHVPSWNRTLHATLNDILENTQHYKKIADNLFQKHQKLRPLMRIPSKRFRNSVVTRKTFAQEQTSVHRGTTENPILKNLINNSSFVVQLNPERMNLTRRTALKTTNSFPYRNYNQSFSRNSTISKTGNIHNDGHVERATLKPFPWAIIKDIHPNAVLNGNFSNVSTVDNKTASSSLNDNKKSLVGGFIERQRNQAFLNLMTNNLKFGKSHSKTKNLHQNHHNQMLFSKF